MQQPRYHIIVDIDQCKPTIADASALDDFICRAVAAVDMKIIAGPIVCAGVPENPGLSGFAVLDFSHVSVHTFTDKGEAMVDIFSCKPYDPTIVQTLTKETFATEGSQMRLRQVFWGTETEVHDPRDVSHIGEYLDEYYDRLTEENNDIGMFLRQAVAGVKERFPVIKVLDAGCGPTMLYWASFLDTADEYHGLDVRQDHLDHVRGLADQGLAGQIEARYHDLSYELGRLQSPAMTPKEYFAHTARKVKTLIAHDMNQRWPYASGDFPVVMSVFGLECVDSVPALQRGMAEAYRLLPPGGRFIFVTVAETETWKIGEKTLRCLKLSAELLADAARATGFAEVVVKTHPATTALERQQGYQSMVFGYADRL